MKGPSDKAQQDSLLHLRRTLAILVLLGPVSTLHARASNLEWQRYTIPTTGLSVDVPTSIFGEDGGTTEGNLGRQLFTKDRRANLTIRSFPNPSNDPPAIFLQKMNPPTRIQYRRVTSKFFAVSSIRNGRTWYNRCNQVDRFMNCVLINYPAMEDREWDAVVTRISLSLGK
jgi:hypothetical protein